MCLIRLPCLLCVDMSFPRGVREEDRIWQSSFLDLNMREATGDQLPLEEETKRYALPSVDATATAVAAVSVFGSTRVFLSASAKSYQRSLPFGKCDEDCICVTLQ